jgi:hypothetical protein
LTLKFLPYSGRLPQACNSMFGNFRPNGGHFFITSLRCLHINIKLWRRSTFGKGSCFRNEQRGGDQDATRNVQFSKELLPKLFRILPPSMTLQSRFASRNKDVLSLGRFFRFVMDRVACFLALCVGGLKGCWRLCVLRPQREHRAEKIELIKKPEDISRQ